MAHLETLEFIRYQKQIKSIQINHSMCHRKEVNKINTKQQKVMT